MNFTTDDNVKKNTAGPVIAVLSLLLIFSLLSYRFYTESESSHIDITLFLIGFTGMGIAIYCMMTQCKCRLCGGKVKFTKRKVDRLLGMQLSMKVKGPNHLPRGGDPMAKHWYSHGYECRNCNYHQSTQICDE